MSTSIKDDQFDHSAFVNNDVMEEKIPDKKAMMKFTKLQRAIDAMPSAYPYDDGTDLIMDQYNFCVHGKRFLFATKSFGIFDESSEVRHLIVWLITWKRFDQFILFLILANSVVLSITDYEKTNQFTGELITEGSIRNSIVESADPIFTTLFTVECILKILGMGFISEKGSYLRDPWNWLDFLVATAGMVAMIPRMPNVTALRTFRVLRPLRSLNAVAGMKRLVNALLKSIPELMNVLAFMGFLFLIFGILGMQLWQGLLHARCRATPYPVAIDMNQSLPLTSSYLNKVLANPELYRCLGEDGKPIPIFEEHWTHDTSPWKTPKYCIWPIVTEDYPRRCDLDGNAGYVCKINETCGSNYDWFGNPRFTHKNSFFAQMIMEDGDYIADLSWGYTNFDHIGYAFLSVFQCITMEGWVNIMYNVQDAGYTHFSGFFFVILIFMGSFFMLNLTLAVIWDNFSQATANEENEELNGINKTSPGNSQDTTTNPFRKSNLIKRICKRIALHPYFNYFITTLILVNTITLSLDKYPSDPSLEYYVEMINFGLTIAFTFESILKILGLGYKGWAVDRFNLFDGFIVLVSIVELIFSPPEFTGLSNEDNVGNGGGGSLSALRTFRLVRVFKLARSWTSLQQLLLTMFRTLSEIGNFSVLLLLFIYIYALVGMQFFAFRFRFDIYGYPVERINTEAYALAYKPRAHFDSLLWSFVTIFQILTGENWNDVMYDGWRSSGWTAALYFVSLVVFGNFIVLNLFLAILLGNFQSHKDIDDNTDKVSEIDDAIHYSPAKKVSMMPVALGETKSSSTEKKRSSRYSHGQLNPFGASSKSILPHCSPEKVKGQAIEDISSSGSNSKLIIPRGKSLFLFKIDHKIRRYAIQIVTHAYFDNIVLALIILSSIALALDNPLYPRDHPLILFLTDMDIVFTIIFTMEMIVKIISVGFFFHKNSYLRNGWNVLDFIIVIISLLSLLANGNSSLRSFRSLRTFRALRPLRMISRNPGLKLVVNALFASMPQILNVMMVCILFFAIFSIVGVNYFKGKFYACGGIIFDELLDQQKELITYPQLWSHLSSSQQNWFHIRNTSKEYIALNNNNNLLYPTSRQLCTWFGASWIPVIHQNFDNVLKGCSTLFDMSTTEQWVQIMYAGVDATHIDMQPIRDYNQNWALFFIFFMIVGSFFMMQLFVGVVIDNFNSMKERLGNSIFLTESQKEWVIMQEAMLKLSPLRQINPPKNLFRRYCFYFSRSSTLESIVMGCIILNTLIMGFTYFGQNDELEKAIEFANRGFGYIFLFEAFMKIIGLGIYYFHDLWNIFDFLIVLGTSFGMILNSDGKATVGNVATIIRAFRVGRIFRLIRTAPTLTQLFNTLLITLPSLANIGSLLFLLYFIFSVMGVQLFAKIKLSENLNQHANFQTFGSAMLTLVRSSTGEDWNAIMYDCMVETDCVVDLDYNSNMCGFNNSQICQSINGCGTIIAFPFFVSFTLLVTFVMLNVFIAVILEGFSDEKKRSISSLPDNEFDTFVRLWAVYDPKATCFMDWYNLIPFLSRLNPPMGLGNSKAPRKLVYRLIKNLDIPVYRGNRVFFTDVAQKIAKHLIQLAFGEELKPLPQDHHIVKKIKRNNVQKRHSKAEYGLNHFYSAIAIHSSYKNYKFRQTLRERVQEIQRSGLQHLDQYKDDK